MTRRLAIVVPAKDTAQAKSRLAPLLLPETRRALADALFRQTLGVLSRARLDASIFVVTDSPRLAEEAGEFGAEVIRDSGTSLTEAVELATRHVARAGFDSQLVIPSDIALLDAKEIGQLLAARGAGPSVVLCPSADEDGTNALLTTPPDALPIWYGPGSFQRYCRAAQSAGVALTLIKLAGLGLDLDTPDDVRRYVAQAPKGPILDLLRPCLAAAS